MEKINEEKFNQIVQSGESAVFQFSANWCGPCKVLTPVLTTICRNKGVNVYKIDVGENTNLAMEKNVTSIPSVHLYGSGKLLDRFEGSRSKSFLNDALNVAFGGDDD